MNECYLLDLKNVTEFSVENTDLFTRWLKVKTHRLDVENNVRNEIYVRNYYSAAGPSLMTHILLCP